MRRRKALATALLALLAIVVLPPVPMSADHGGRHDGLPPACPPICPSPEGSDPNDGRIGDWGGDYFVYSQNGSLEVWRLKEGTNQGEPLVKFPLGDVANLHQQGDSRYDAKSGTTVTRWGNTIEVSGWGNGNNTFGRNSRVFKATDCPQCGTGFKNAREKLNDLKARAKRLLDLLDDPETYDRRAVVGASFGLAAELRESADNEPDPDVAAEAAEAADDLDGALRERGLQVPSAGGI